MLCVSLLWGDFIFFLLDQDLPHIFPLKLKEMGAGDRTIMLLLKTIPSAMVFLIAPAISFHSDRHRGRWGRRIPYLVWSTPLVGLCMVLIGCHDDLAAFFVGNADSVSVLGLSYSRAAVSLFLLCAMIVVFTFVNIFTNTIYWYLFNDIVPKEFMTRFMALFRIVMYLASMLYNRYILPDSLAHFRLLFIAGGIVYTVGFLLMFLLVREGKYPPPPPLVMESAKWGEIWSTFVGVVARKWEQVRGYSRQRAAVVLFLAFLVLLPVSGLGLMMAVLCLVGCGL